MKLKMLLAGMALFATSSVVMADEGESSSKSQSPEDYIYTTHLDISKIISMTEPAQICGTTPVVMIYEDSHGERHSLRYQVMGTGCSGG
ncbi:DUF2790 domain-containing protein [Pseudomonas frederiksbergensis]|uniref:DUF2790 domain-containing protein n=1 Tax=Pseudomonas frederiksbergensis TaxID=104087 RepID=UPI003D20579B